MRRHWQGGSLKELLLHPSIGPLDKEVIMANTWRITWVIKSDLDDRMTLSSVDVMTLLSGDRMVSLTEDSIVEKKTNLDYFPGGRQTI